jgi:tRNA-splicing ligase RtcB
MNTKTLVEAGIPHDLHGLAMDAIKAMDTANKSGANKYNYNISMRIKLCALVPSNIREDNPVPELYALAQAILNHKQKEPLVYNVWGDIDQNTLEQMDLAAKLPSSYAAALMPDAHLGYGLPIGGVLATEDTVIPYAVGVDIACRMKLSVYQCDKKKFEELRPRFRDALKRGTRFGVGQEFEDPHEHPVMDEDWKITEITRRNKDKAWYQLGTSGSGNHFAEFGSFETYNGIDELGLEMGEYIALMTHSGSRGTGAAVCKEYSKIAESRLPKHQEEFKNLAWLPMESEAGKEYWAAMNLMGRYAAANHDVIHRSVSALVGLEPIATIENHHNFAWIENHGGKDVVVHRKGATPAGKGVLGVIPGSMGTSAYVVRGLGNPDSLNSASHGAGRAMSRTEAKKQFTIRETEEYLWKYKGVEVISAGSDEVPGAYKDIDVVMGQQEDLVAPLGEFFPLMVKMCGDGSRAED